MEVYIFGGGIDASLDPFGLTAPADRHGMGVRHEDLAVDQFSWPVLQ